ncbi:MAG: FMN-binding protein [Verrucomicrobia bacterium]|nr:FMN-binding protein [Verrucomicrobiota bacterium]
MRRRSDNGGRIRDRRGLSDLSRSLVYLWLALGLSGPAWAERFLTVSEAQKICFPEADSFEAQVVRFTPEQIRSVERRSRTAVLNKGNRIWLARDEGRLVGVLVLDYVLGKHELIDYVVGLSPAGAVQTVEVLAYRESYGGQIRDSAWRAQFQGKTSAAPLRLHEDIYNISGATLSCRHVTEGVRRVVATYEQVVQPRLLAAGELAAAR